MRLTESKLKQLIKEALKEGIGDNFYGMYGNRTQSPKSFPTTQSKSQRPQLPEGIPPQHVGKLKKMLQSDDDSTLNQAFAFIESFTSESSFNAFKEAYLEYLSGTPPREIQSYEQAAGPDERIEARKEIYDQVNQRAASLYPNDPDAAYDWAYKKIEKAGLLEEGILQQMEAEKILRDEFFRVKELKAQGKATEEELTKAYQDMINLDTDQFYTPEELASFEAEKAQREIDDQARMDQEFEDERRAKQRLDRDRISALKMRSGYKDRGIDMGPDDPGDVDDLYPDLREGLMYEGDNSVLALFEDATLEEGGNVCGACLFEQLQEASCGCPNLVYEAEYQGRKVTLNKPTRGDVKKFKVYVKDPKTGKIKKVNFGDPNMKIKKSNPKRRKSFRARHNCDNPGPKTKARYWSCKKW